MLTRSRFFLGTLGLALGLLGCDSTPTDPVAGGGTGGTGGSASPVPIYILVGGGTNPGVTDVYRDSQLEAGQVFIMAKDPLQANSTYTVTYSITAGGTVFTSPTWSFQTGASNDPPNPGGTVLDVVNLRRTQTAVPIVQNSPTVLAVAARRHAGYQCEDQARRWLGEGDAITHGEPFTAYDFYIHSNSGARVHLANGGAALPDPLPGPTAFSWPHAATHAYETIATSSGPQAAAFLWNSVYHRIPMMRHDVTHLGEGDRVEAEDDDIYKDLLEINRPFVSGNTATDAQYQTINWTRANAAQSGVRFWPAHNQIGLNLRFSTNREIPDPVGTYGEGGNAAWNNGTPEDDLVGLPLHISLPTTGDITSISVTLTRN